MCNAVGAFKRRAMFHVSTKHKYIGMIIAQLDSTQTVHLSYLC